MVQEIKGVGSDPGVIQQTVEKKNKAVKVDAGIKVDYKVSFQKETLTAVTYSRAAKIETVDFTGITDLGDLVARLLERQGVTWEAALGGETVEIDDETRAEAQALIADDGYWGIEQTSDRIVSSAVANAGNDPTRFEEIKEAVTRGFEMARKALGGTLPEISIKTFDTVMEKLEKWAVEGTKTA